MRHVFQVIALFSIVLFAGCVSNREFFAESRSAVPAMRAYALEHLRELSQQDRQFIAGTEPRLAQANYVEVHFIWTNVCEVLASAPPCRPYQLIDLRKRQ
jgi:hypothetical protein